VSGVVSERARDGLDYFVAQAANNALVSADKHCAVVAAGDTAASERDVVMLTVSSYTFRVLVFIHFESNAATRAYFGSLVNTSAEEMAGERFLDVVMERGNLFCGALNRDLAQFYPHTGMSTPCILHRSAVEHIDAVKPAFTRRYRAELTDELALHLTLAVCAFDDLDFQFAHRKAEATDTAGELEMF
jgi:hypothetical protein